MSHELNDSWDNHFANPVLCIGLGCFCFHISNKRVLEQQWFSSIDVVLHLHTFLTHNSRYKWPRRWCKQTWGDWFSPWRTARSFNTWTWSRIIRNKSFTMATVLLRMQRVYLKLSLTLRPSWDDLRTRYICICGSIELCVMTLNFVRFLEDNVNCNFLLFVCME